MIIYYSVFVNSSYNIIPTRSQTSDIDAGRSTGNSGKEDEEGKFNSRAIIH